MLKTRGMGNPLTNKAGYKTCVCIYIGTVNIEILQMLVHYFKLTLKNKEITWIIQW